MRRGAVPDAAGEAAGAVRVPLLGVPAADELRVRHLRHLPALPAPRRRAAVLLHVRLSLPTPLSLLYPPVLWVVVPSIWRVVTDEHTCGGHKTPNGFGPYALLVGLSIYSPMSRGWVGEGPCMIVYDMEVLIDNSWQLFLSPVRHEALTYHTGK